MGWRFRRLVKILPGIRLNFSRSGVSTSVGVRGAHVTVDHGKVRTTVGLPGSGLSYTETTKAADNASQEAGRAIETPTESPTGNAWRGWLWIGLSILIVGVLMFAVACGNVGVPAKPVAAPPTPAPAPAPVRDTRAETFELQERCARDAAAWFKHAWEDGKPLQNVIPNYTNHYNAKTGRCLLIVTSDMFGKTKDGASYHLTMKTLMDVLENRDIANVTASASNTQPMVCQFEGVRCNSSDEWDKLAKPYMEQ